MRWLTRWALHLGEYKSVSASLGGGRWQRSSGNVWSFFTGRRMRQLMAVWGASGDEARITLKSTRH